MQEIEKDLGIVTRVQRIAVQRHPDHGGVRSALALVDVRVQDHFIVSNPDITSMAERGLA